MNKITSALVATFAVIGSGFFISDLSTFQTVILFILVFFGVNTSEELEEIKNEIKKQTNRS